MMEIANIQRDEMYRTFNCGVGFVLVVPAAQAEQAIVELNAQGESAFLLGEIRAGSADQAVQIA